MSRPMKARTAEDFFLRVKNDIIKEARKAPKYFRSSRAARIAFQEIDSAIKANRMVDFGCSKGCSYCCYFQTDITAGEAFVLANAVRLMPENRRQDVMRRLCENAKNLKEMSYTDRMLSKTPCALLDLNTNACSVYSSRPTNCRKWHAIYPSACKADFENPGCKERNVMIDPTAMNAAALVYHAYKKASREPMGELHQGVLMAIDPDSESRFAKGVPVFEGWTASDECATEEELAEVQDREMNVAAAAAERSRSW